MLSLACEVLDTCGELWRRELLAWWCRWRIKGERPILRIHQVWVTQELMWRDCGCRSCSGNDGVQRRLPGFDVDGDRKWRVSLAIRAYPFLRLHCRVLKHDGAGGCEAEDDIWLRTHTRLRVWSIDSSQPGAHTTPLIKGGLTHRRPSPTLPVSLPHDDRAYSATGKVSTHSSIKCKCFRTSLY
jgi:hypothetical protein